MAEELLHSEPAEIPAEPARTPLEIDLSPEVGALTERRVREDLRQQIARLERRLGELFASAFPREGIDWHVGALGGPRVLGIEELERVRDALAFRLSEAQSELARRADIEEANRGVLESMIAEPERYRWVRISNDDIGERGCRHWHSRPRWGIVGMLLNWWRVKLSSGCPLATGLRPPDAKASWPRSVASAVRAALRPLPRRPRRRSRPWLATMPRAGAPPRGGGSATSARPHRGDRFLWSRSACSWDS
jgi:hypothetical protein